MENWKIAGKLNRRNRNQRPIKRPKAGPALAGDAVTEPARMEAEQPPLEPFPFPVPRVLPEHAPVTERYFEARFFRPKSGLLKCEFPVDDQCILFHSNK